MNKVNILLATIVVIAALLLTSLVTGQMQRMQSAFMSVVAPFLKTGTVVQQGIGAMSQGLKTLPQLEEENRRLLTENKELRAINQTLRDLEAENNRLRVALDYRERADFRLVAAQVISRDASTWWSTIMINRGFEDGVEAEMPVITDVGLVGKVINTSKNAAVVLLATDETCKVGAFVEGTQGQKGIVSGMRLQDGPRAELQMNFLSKTANLEPGAKVYSQGVSGGVFPPGLFIGQVQSFRARELDGQAIVEPAVDFATLSDVFVIMRR
jgi:rod shape-determining protein MreC